MKSIRIRPVNRMFGRSWLAIAALALGSAAGCGGAADAGSASIAVAQPPVFEDEPPVKAGTRGKKAKLARNRPPQYLDARFGK